MSNYSTINPVIQFKLNEKRKILSRQGSSAIFSPSGENSRKQHQQNIVKTPYIIMVSTDKIQDEESNEIGNDDFFMLSNQEYSENNKKINVGTNLYNARSLKGKTKVPYRPAPGIKDLTSEFTSTNNTAFNRQVTVNFTCYSLADLEELNERFMSLGRKVYVQWGWATDKKIEPLIDNDGKVIYTGSDPNDSKTEITRLQEEVITQGQGDFDAVIGFVKNISFSLREDGGFDCTTELLAQGINILDTQVDVDSQENTQVSKDSLSYGGTQFSGFLDEINNLHKSALDKIQVKKKKEIYRGKLSAESFDIDEKYTGEGTSVRFQNLTAESKGFIYGKNFIVTKTLNTTAEEFNPVVGYSGQQFELGDGPSGDVRLSFQNNGNRALDFNTNWDTRNPLIDPNECWVRWGWFEDNLLNKYFALFEETASGLHTPKAISYYRSITPTGLYRKKERIFNRDTNRYEISESDSTAEEYNRKTSGPFQQTAGVQNIKEPSKGIGNETQYIKDFESKKVKIDENFITTNIREFLFPGRFSVLPDISSLEEKYNKIKEKRNNETTDRNRGVEGSEEYKLNQEYLEINRQFKLAQQQIENFKNIEELKEQIKTSGISTTDLDQITDTGFDKYVFLYELEQILKDNNLIEQFNVSDSVDENGEQSGYLRNIFINIGHLQSIFKEGGLTTLGETMNVLFKSLSANTINEINLTNSANLDIPGVYTATERTPTDDPDYGIRYNRDVSDGFLYEFPVHQQDSIVLSQEISTDLTNTQMQVLMSKNLSSKVKEQIDKKRISLEHHNNFDETSLDGTIPTKSTRKKPTNLLPAFVKYGLNFQNPFGADPDYPINAWGINRSGGSQESIDKENIKEDKIKQESQTEKDLELASSTFKELPIPYTIDGKLKGEFYDDLSKKLNLVIKEVKNETTGETETITEPKVSDYGLIGLTTTLTLTGIAGIYPSNVFTTSYLPTKFKVNNALSGKKKSSCHFWTTGVTQNCSAETWTTQLEARMAWRFVKDE